jgi:hypothetical protein
MLLRLGNSVRVHTGKTGLHASIIAANVIDLAESQLRLIRQLHSDEAEVPRKGGAQDEIEAEVSDVLASGGRATLACELAKQRLRQLQIDEAEAARPGGGTDEIMADQVTEGSTLERHSRPRGRLPNPTKVPEPFPMRTHIRHVP